MAQSIKGDAAPKKRGRPTKAEIEARKQSERQAQAEINAKEGGAPAAAGNGAPSSAPAFGHNRATEGLFLRHVQACRAQDRVISDLQEKVKAAKGKRKDIRNLAKADGIVLAEMDEAVEALETERVDLLAREERRVLYFEWLGLPTLRSAESPKIEKDPAQRWGKLGEIAGRLGEDRKLPDGVPPEHVQDWLFGWERGQKALMRDLPLTAGAFNEDGSEKTKEQVQAEKAGSAAAAAETPPEGAPTVQAPASDGDEALLILREEHFAAGTALADANKKTLLAGFAEAWSNADRVVALFGAKKRVLKEPDGDLASGYYEDTGEAEVEVTDEEPAEADLVAQAGEIVTGQAEDVAGEDSAETFH